MIRLGKQIVGLLTLATYLLGVSMVEAADTPSSRHWVTTLDPVDHMKASFPHKAIEMTFDIPFKNTPAKGQLHLFSSSTKTGVFLLSALTLSSVDEHILEEAAFKHTFETHLVPRLFYSPQLFRRNQTFSSSVNTFKGKPALSFQFSYQDRHGTRILKGIATVKGHTLYTLFYLSSKGQFNEADLQQFIQSFDLVEEAVANSAKS